MKNPLTWAGAKALAAALAAALACAAPAAAAPPSPAAPAAVSADIPDAGVTVKRDTFGVPHVYAETTRGLFLGYGYAVAEDRLFQMEMARRAVLGTSAEVLGPDYLEIDRRSRSSFDPASIQAQIAALPQEDRDILEGYAEGMNRKIGEILEDRGRLLPKQFADYGFEPARWTGYDVAMIFVGTMANRFSDSASELSNLQVLQQLTDAYGPDKGQALFDQILWTEDPTAPTTVPREDTKAPNRLATDLPATLATLQRVDPGLSDDGVERMRDFGGHEWPAQKPEASNLWIVGSQKSAEKGSVLLNGPQFSWFNPSYVYGIGLHGAGYDVTGNTPFAHPAILFGTNKTITWGATAGPLDVNDVYQERLNPADPHEYWHDGAWRDMDVRTETVRVAGQDAVEIPVYSTVHGFVTSVDAANGVAYSKRRSWTGTEIQTLLAWTKIAKAKDWDEYLAQAEKVGITINWYYADNAGNIGYVSPGRLPIRPTGQDPRLPVTGDGSMEWEGFQPFSENPQVYNPKQGYIVNWNNQSAAGHNAGSGSWGPVDRVNEIIARLESQQKFTADEVWDINEQTSFADLNIRYLRPFLEHAVQRLPAQSPEAEAARIVLDWDGQARDRDGDGAMDGAQPAVMRAWVPLLIEEVLKDDLPETVYANYARTYPSPRPAEGMKLVYNALLGDRAGVPQTQDFLDGTSADDVVLGTYQRALAQVRAAHGEDPAGWDVVPVERHVFSFKNFIGVPQSGADEQLTALEYMNRGTQNDLVQLTPERAAMCTAAPPGQSGFVAPDGTPSPHYLDQLRMYGSFDCKTERLYPEELEANLESTTVL